MPTKSREDYFTWKPGDLKVIKPAPQKKKPKTKK